MTRCDPPRWPRSPADRAGFRGEVLRPVRKRIPVRAVVEAGLRPGAAIQGSWQKQTKIGVRNIIKYGITVCLKYIIT